MVNMESAIEETLSKPELVIRSRTDEMTNLNYRYYYRTKVSGKWLCVVVKYAVEDIFIQTHQHPEVGP